MALPIAAGIEIVQDKRVSSESRMTATDPAPSLSELDAMELPDYGLTCADQVKEIKQPEAAYSPTGSFPSTVDATQASKTPAELEQSQPPTPLGHDAVNLVPTFWYPRMNRWRYVSACLEYFANGLNDSAPGALIPYIEQFYGIGYAVVSTIWICNAGVSTLFRMLRDIRVLINEQLDSSWPLSSVIPSAQSLAERGVSCSQSCRVCAAVLSLPARSHFRSLRLLSLL